MEDAFAELYRRTRTRVYAAVLRVVGSPELAGEVTQEAYLEIWQQSGRFQEDRGSALGWMMTIARRRAVDRVRSVSRALALEQRYAKHNGALESVDIWDDVAARMDAQQIRHTLPALTPLQRQALTLTYLEERPAAEVARLLGVPLGTIKSRIRDGLTRLRTVVAEVQVHSPAEVGRPPR
jgi:RNA polymerase sigma-70 factor (ECF subfamily)